MPGFAIFLGWLTLAAVRSICYVLPMAFSYFVSLQVKHPDAKPENIVAGIGLPPSRFWTVGEQRATPKGIPLPGKYRESYCVFRLGERDDGELAAFLRDTLAKLEPAAAFIEDLRRTGGRLNFFVSWSLGDRGEVFDVELLAKMARLGIDLGIEPLA